MTNEETARLSALKRYAILDTGPEPAFERIVRLAAHIFGAPVALISFVDDDRLWFKARKGLELSEVPRAATFCDVATTLREAVVVSDASQDPRFQANPLVTEAPHVRFYAGAPLMTPDGLALGTLCVIDTKPRVALSDADRLALDDLAAMVMDELELRSELARREVVARSTALREQLLTGNAEAATPIAAINTAISAVREATGSLVCLFFRSSPDSRHLHLLGGQGEGSAFDESYIDGVRATPLTLDNGLSGLAIRAGEQLLFNNFTPEFLSRYRGVGLAAERGVQSMLITPFSLGTDHYTFALGFAENRSDVTEVKLIMQEVATSLRPLLRRMRETEAAELFRRAVESSGDGVLISDAEPISGAGPAIRYVNDAFLNQTGFVRDEVIGRTPDILDGPETSDSARSAIRGALAAGASVRQEIKTYRRDGSSFWADLTVAPIADATGWLTHWVAVQRDVTAQKTEAFALAEREAYFRYFFEQSPAPMWLYDHGSLAFLEVNQAAIETYGWSRKQFLAMTILDIRPEQDREAVRASAHRSVAGPRISGPWSHVTASGDVRQVQIRSRVIEFRGTVATLVTVWDLTDRLRAENDARELAHQLNATLESISDGFFTLNAQWRFTYANPQAVAIFGQAGGSLLGRTIAEVLPGTSGAAMLEKLRVILRNDATERFLHHDARSGRWFDVTGYPAVAGLTVYLRDITARRLGEERLRLLETAVEQLNDIVIITEAEPFELPGPRIIFVNSAFERLTGFPSEEAIGRTPRMLQGERTSRHELDRIRAALAAWQPVRAELLDYTKDGRELWMELDIVPVSDVEGRITHWVSVQRDVTERKRVQNRLEEQAAMLDQARDAILARDLDHRITFWNRSAEQLYGWTAKEVIGKSVLDLIHVDPLPFKAACTLLHAQGHWSGRLNHRRKDGRMIIVEANWTLVSDSEGRQRAVLAVNTDVTERLALEEQLREAQRMEAIGQLTGGIAHDFNNLLTVVLGNAEMLKDDLAALPALQPMAALLLSAAERGAALTSRLLAFARRQSLAPRFIDANELLKGLQPLLRRAVGERVELEVLTTPGLWTAKIDPPQLETALLNLCINARDAMPQGGKLTVETGNVTLDADYAAGEPETIAGDYVMIAVSDIGDGMPPEIVARAFEPFFTTKDVGKGSGLGLSMVYGFVKQSQGHVKIYSEVGHGTTVRLYIPRAQGAAQEPEATSTPGNHLRGNERILLVEDDAMVRVHAARQLRGLGYQVELAADAREAMEAIHRGTPYDLLFTDVVMPGGMSGHELVAEARRLRPSLRVLLTSGYTEGSGLHQGWLEPGNVLLQKPYRRRELADKVRQVLDATD